eukprot:TRINITY_DN264_c0_g1_i12.p1 TRINITY_DN264_c0_g1~~TRINITY_DN264_c0_g1_i12.p1  ORF type:complete len:865 (+),score=105.71 TRINITY_DN264_c0_g1_i12:5243-7837(+)
MSTTFGTKQISADQHASLTAPARDRSITVDDFIEQPVHADPESDSDADENEPAVTPAQKRPRSAIRRSNSALSLESEAEEDHNDPPRPKKQRSQSRVLNSSSSPITTAVRAPNAPSLQIPSHPVSNNSRAKAFFSNRSPISPNHNTSSALLNVSDVAHTPNPLPQPLNSPKITPSPPPPSIASYIFPRSPNAPPLSIDPSVPSQATPPRTTRPLTQSGPSPQAPKSPTPLKERSFRNPTSIQSPPVAVTSNPTPSTANVASPIAPETTVSAITRTSLVNSCEPTPSKLPAPTITNPVSSDPTLISRSPKKTVPPSSKLPPRPTLHIPPNLVANPSPSAAPAVSKASANPTQQPPQPNTPDTTASVQERNSPMQTPTSAEAPLGDSVQTSQPVRTIPGQAKLPPLSHDGLVNIRKPKPADDEDWDRFVFFKHRPRRHDFGNNCYLSDYSPFAALPPVISKEPPSTICAVCGGASNLLPCSSCVCAFHAKCMSPYPVTTSPWYCKGCRSAGLPNGNPIPISDPPLNISLAAQALHRPIIDAREGNPVDLILHPSLMAMFREHYEGHDWLQCHTCKRRRIVPSGLLSESVKIPFICSGMFWVPKSEQNCTSHMDPQTQRIEAYINEQAALRGDRRKALLESFGDGSDDESECSLRNDPSNVKLAARPSTPRPGQPQKPVLNHTAIPNGTSIPNPAQTIVPSVQSNTERLIEQTRAVRISQPSTEVTQTNGFAPMEVDTTVTTQPNYSNTNRTPAENDTNTGTTPQNSSATQPQKPVPSSGTATEPKKEATKQEDSVSSPSMNPEDIQQELLMFIADLELDEPTEDALTDLALTNNKTLAHLYVAFRSNKDRFKRQAIRFAKRTSKAS